MKLIYSKYFIYPVFVLVFVSLCLVTINIRDSGNSKLRLLEDDSGIKKICEENEELYNYYYKSQDYEITDKNFGKMNAASRIILDFLSGGFKTKYIFKYIWYTKVYVFFLILLIIIIILTIYYSIASCIRCCTEKCCDFFSFACCKNKCFKKTICILVPFIYLIVFILAVLAIVFAAGAVQKFSGTICVGLQLVKTFVVGDIRDVRPKWEGINIVSTVLESLYNMTSINNQETVDNINKNKNQFITKYQEFINQLNESSFKTGRSFKIKAPKMNSDDDEEKEKIISPVHSYKWGPLGENGTVLHDIFEFDYEIFTELEDIFEVFDTLYDFLGCETNETDDLVCDKNTFLSELLLSASNIIKQIEKPISNIEEKITKPVQNIYDQVNTTVMGIFVVLIIFVMLYCILIEC